MRRRSHENGPPQVPTAGVAAVAATTSSGQLSAGGESTVIAPTDDAFAKIDTALARPILTRHVVPAQASMSPAQVRASRSTTPGWYAGGYRSPTRLAT
jgi:uncharacterized surface protein with fasciclin (FAS1) repeats